MIEKGLKFGASLVTFVFLAIFGFRLYFLNLNRSKRISVYGFYVGALSLLLLALNFRTIMSTIRTLFYLLVSNGPVSIGFTALAIFLVWFIFRDPEVDTTAGTKELVLFSVPTATLTFILGAIVATKGAAALKLVRAS